jgi:hypothetical protein
MSPDTGNAPHTTTTLRPAGRRDARTGRTGPGRLRSRRLLIITLVVALGLLGMPVARAVVDGGGSGSLPKEAEAPVELPVGLPVEAGAPATGSPPGMGAQYAAMSVAQAPAQADCSRKAPRFIELADADKDGDVDDCDLKAMTSSDQEIAWGCAMYDLRCDELAAPPPPPTPTPQPAPEPPTWPLGHPVHDDKENPVTFQDIIDAALGNGEPDCTQDADGDGLHDYYDDFPDANGDGLHDDCQADPSHRPMGCDRGDADGDGIANFADERDDDLNNDGQPDCATDIDGNGQHDCEQNHDQDDRFTWEDPDEDDNSNGIPNTDDLCSTFHHEDHDTTVDCLDPDWSGGDSDTDGTPNARDSKPYDPTVGEQPTAQPAAPPAAQTPVRPPSHRPTARPAPTSTATVSPAAPARPATMPRPGLPGTTRQRASPPPRTCRTRTRWPAWPSRSARRRSWPS